MGGRGSASGLVKMAIDAQNGELNWTGNVGYKVASNLKEALGDKGAPKTISEAIKLANPNFSKAYAEYSMNCQRCVQAYEALRRGYNVEAQATYAGDDMGNVMYMRNVNGLVESRSKWMGSFKNVKTDTVGAKGVSKTVKNIEAKMKQYGAGARGIIKVRWSAGGGHVFNVENVGGKIKYIDAQLGKTVNITDYLSYANNIYTNLVRTDNLQFTNRARLAFRTKS